MICTNLSSEFIRAKTPEVNPGDDHGPFRCIIRHWGIPWKNSIVDLVGHIGKKLCCKLICSCTLVDLWINVTTIGLALISMCVLVNTMPSRNAQQWSGECAHCVPIAKEFNEQGYNLYFYSFYFVHCLTFSWYIIQKSMLMFLQYIFYLYLYIEHSSYMHIIQIKENQVLDNVHGNTRWSLSWSHVDLSWMKFELHCRKQTQQAW